LKATGTLANAIHQVIPKDRPFSLADLLVLLNEAGRDASLPVLRMTVHRMLKRGKLRAVAGSVKHKRSIYAVPELDVDPRQQMTLEMAELVLRGASQAMMAVEIMVAMCKERTRFKSDRNHWSLCCYLLPQARDGEQHASDGRGLAGHKWSIKELLAEAANYRSIYPYTSEATLAG
jgi:hypothetical protein